LEDDGCGCLIAVFVVNLGMAIAVAVSWSEYHSVLIAIFHGTLGWLWLGYRALNTP
jgi:hypothetical protein